MTGATLFHHARLIDPASGRDDRGSLLVEGERIKAVHFGPGETGAPEGTTKIDLGGKCLAPGLIDASVTTGEPGAEHRETLASASAAAAAGGITTMVVMPNTQPVIDDAALVDFVTRRARDTASIRVLPMAALTHGTRGEIMCEMGLLKDAGAIAFTDGPKTVANARVMRRAMAYSTLFDALICNHVEEPELAERTQMNEGELATRLGLAGAPKIAEQIMLSRDIALAEITGARYHALQISTPESAAMVSAAREHGIKVSCGAAAHHLLLNENDIGSYRTFCKVRPPLRSETDRRGLVAALEAGLIDIVVSAHLPQGAEDKRLPFADAADGCIGLETLLAVLLELVHGGELTLLEALRPVTIGPAKLLGLESGRLAAGAPADITIFDPEIPYVLRLEDLKSKCRNSPFEGHKFQGRVLKTIVRGKTIFEAAP